MCVLPGEPRAGWGQPALCQRRHPLAALNANQEPHGHHHAPLTPGGPRGAPRGRAQAQEGPHVPLHLPRPH